ncbi:MAG: gliding motility protein GldN [Tenuifilaceae bacterium]|jgi:gliding motility associated protien GldN|nr:gliding motility protein GldN [Tenuifilaceae bacterium]
MKRAAIFLACSVALVSLAIGASAQVITEPLVNDGIYERETIKQRIPVPYPHLREADMMWTKRVWRIVDLRQRMNHPLYFPTTRMHDRSSLVQRLMDAIKYNEINAYDADIDDEFSALISYDQILTKLGANDRERADISPITGRDTIIVIPGSINWAEIKQLEIKEEWYFDRQYSTMHVRIIGICPIRVYTRIAQGAGDDDLEMEGETLRSRLFWVYYPHARPILANTAAFNSQNDAQRNSFDDLFFKRRFSSYIVAESNVHNNRRINEYVFGGLPNMQESERIKQEIFNWEHDVWEF